MQRMSPISWILQEGNRLEGRQERLSGAKSLMPPFSKLARDGAADAVPSRVQFLLPPY
jgi:hypothetical protein